MLLAYGEPIWIDRDEETEPACTRVERAMNRLEGFAETHAADAAVGRRI